MAWYRCTGGNNKKGVLDLPIKIKYPTDLSDILTTGIVACETAMRNAGMIQAGDPYVVFISLYEYGSFYLSAIPENIFSCDFTDYTEEVPYFTITASGPFMNCRCADSSRWDAPSPDYNGHVWENLFPVELHHVGCVVYSKSNELYDINGNLVFKK